MSSINHYYSSSDLPEAHCWSPYLMDSSAFWPIPQHHQRPNRSFSFNLNNQDDEETLDDNNNKIKTARESEFAEQNQERGEIPKEPLFEKPLTPSDVGKLNRLVIPKQCAEKYFPLNGGAGESSEKGLLLSFEDEMGKSWRFRYSYWNSSQSYVLTKGWSRYVKEKRLDAGDIVLFARHRMDGGRLFIGWRRRNSGQDVGVGVSQPGSSVSGGCGWSRVFYSAHPYQQGSSPSSYPYQPDPLHAGSVSQNQSKTTTSAAGGNSKRLRLFGVNLECQAADESEPSTPEGSPMSSQGQAHHHPHYPNHHMDINFSGGGADVYRRG